ncbi:MAG: DUF3267 domain-containing protein [Salinivirgaceae bacterium]|jgi:hypothetical protein|nr:DUF3267 domain-containing protein [Salinivirgaceae bacterium]
MESIQNKKEQVVTLSGIKLNVYVMLLTIPLWAIICGLYVWIFGLVDYLTGIRDVLNVKIFVLLFLGIPIHEFLHAATWMVLQTEGFENIKFGFNWQSLTPYTHYTKPMVIWKYRWGGAIPGLFMGVIPIILSFVFSNASLNFIGFLFSWAAMGDVISLWMTRKYKANQIVKDHPDELGVIIID